MKSPSTEVQAAVVRMAKAGRPPAEIRAQFGLTRGQVSGIIFRARQAGVVDDTTKEVVRQNWTPDQIDRIKRLWNAGASGSEIARDIGVASRSAIIGVVHRLKAKGEVKVRHVRKSKMRSRFDRADLRLSPVPTLREDDIARVTFHALERHHCRFICCAEAGKAVAAGEPLYCGAPIVAGTSWCSGHLARVSPTATIPAPKIWAPPIEAAEDMPA